MTDLPAASGSFGDKPTLTFPENQPPAELAVQVLSPGDGPLVEAGQAIEVNYYGQVWGGSMFDNSYDRGSSSEFPIGVGAVVACLDTSLVRQPSGSRVLVAVPPHQGYRPRGWPQAG